MAKLPSFQFYPGDWMKDPNLRRCSKAAKGVWMDMICLMFECDDRGVFASGGKPWDVEDIAGAIGGDLAENRACIDELLRKGVATLTKLGAICNRRMVRDEEHRASNRGYQHNHRNSLKPKENSKTVVRPMSDPSSSSTSVQEQTPLTPQGGRARRRPSQATVGLYRPGDPDDWERRQALDLEEERAAYAVWLRLNETYRKQNPWKGKVFDVAKVEVTTDPV